MSSAEELAAAQAKLKQAEDAKQVSDSKGKRRVIKKAEYKTVSYTPSGISVASDEVLNKIHKDLEALGVSSEMTTAISIDIARHCADVGSSEFTTLVNKAANTNLSRMDVASVIKNHCTLRQHNAAYAKVVFNMLIESNEPPLGWAAKGFKDNQKFAAFDFFFGVTSTAAFEPEGGLKRRPTNIELQANLNYKEMQVYRKVMSEGLQVSNSGMVTGGRSGPKPILGFSNYANEG